jgi:spermidine synthase
MSEKSRPGALFALAMLFILAFFVVSGACGLVYQVVWTRKLVLLFGSTSYAVSTVLSIFFLGLGAGAYAGGRIADRARNPLLLYAIFELIIGAWALVFLLLVTRGEAWAVPLLQALHGSRGAGIVVRGLLAAALLLPPCLLMGATLPLLAKFVNREPRVQGLKIGFLYTANTLGAVAGCYYAGFVLLPALGYFQTTLYAAAANAGVGVLALLVALAVRGGGAGLQEELTPDADDAPLAPFTARLVLAAYGISGFAALALEVLWTRLLVIAFLGTTYAYTTMLTLLLAGLVAGGAVGSLVVRLRRPSAAWLGVVMALCASATLYMLGRIAAIPAAEYNNSWDSTVEATFYLAAYALFPAAFLFGVTFPFAISLLGRARATLGRDLGAMYAVNTLCGMLGALAGGYVIIPTLGTHHGAVALAALLCAAGVALIAASPRTAAPFKGAAAGACLLLFVSLYVAAPRDVMEALNTGYVPQSDNLIHFAEHTEGTVAVSEPKDNPEGSDRTLWINRVQATASIVKGVRMNRFQGVLPLLFDRDPKDVLFMCFGSGVTCGTLALSDFRSIDAVEINPGVLAAAPYFEKDNLGVLRNPIVHTHIDDGRNYLLTTTKKYDFITFEPMPLALAGVSTFYTEEYYRLCISRLNPGGMVSQWVPLHSLDPDTIKGLVKTFATVFPHCTAWFVNSDIFLIGSEQPLELDFDAGSARMGKAELAQALDAVGYKDAYEVYASFLMSGPALRDWSARGVPLKDDLPWAEFNAPKLVYSAKVPDAIVTISPFILSPGAFFKPGSISDEDLEAVERRHLAHRNDFAALKGYYTMFAIDTAAAREFLRSLEIDRNDYNAQFYLKQLLEKQVEAFLDWEDYDKLEEVLATAIVYLPEDQFIQLSLGDLYHAKKDTARAREEYQRYLDLGGDAPRAKSRAAAPGAAGSAS